MPITGGVAKTPLVLPACTAIAAYFVYIATSVFVFAQEPWAVVFALASLAAFALSVRSERWRLFVVASVAFAVAGLLVRETLIFLLLAGIASAFFDREHRRFKLAAWLSGAGVFALAYWMHFRAVGPYFSHTPQPSQFTFGGLANLVSGLTFSPDLLGGAGLLAFALPLLGLLGAFLLPNRSMRVFALIATVGPLLTFLILANHARTALLSGPGINYWGATVVPLLYALIPVGIALLPGGAVGSLGGLPDRWTRGAAKRGSATA